YAWPGAADDGHCPSPERNLIREAAKILGVGTELIGPCLDELVSGEGAVREPVPAAGDAGGGTVPSVYLVPFHRAERSVADGLLGLLNSHHERLPTFTRVDWPTALGWLHARAGLDLAPAQQEAVKASPP